jgi:uncharacterized HAD superfamily protein
MRRQRGRENGVDIDGHITPKAAYFQKKSCQFELVFVKLSGTLAI